MNIIFFASRSYFDLQTSVSHYMTVSNYQVCSDDEFDF